MSSGAKFSGDSRHDFYGFLAVAAGLAALVGLALWLARGIEIKDVKDVIAILGAVGAPVVALVSAYFGISAAAKAQSESSANQKDTTDQALRSVSSAHDDAFAAALLVDAGSGEAKDLAARVASRRGQR